VRSGDGLAQQHVAQSVGSVGRGIRAVGDRGVKGDQLAPERLVVGDDLVALPRVRRPWLAALEREDAGGAERVR
jgi:hypothetical protein